MLKPLLHGLVCSILLIALSACAAVQTPATKSPAPTASSETCKSVSDATAKTIAGSKLNGYDVKVVADLVGPEAEPFRKIVADAGNELDADEVVITLATKMETGEQHSGSLLMFFRGGCWVVNWMVPAQLVAEAVGRAS